MLIFKVELQGMYHYKSAQFTKEQFDKLLKKAQSGDSESQYTISDYYSEGLMIDNTIIIEPNESAAFEWTKLAYENGQKDALISYANYISSGLHCKKNESLAIELYLKAIEQKNGLGAFNLARYFSSIGNYEEAFQNYLLCKKMGERFCLEVALCYYYGIGVEKNPEMAIKELQGIIDFPEFSSEYELEEVNYLLGKIYLEGTFVEKSVEKAKSYFISAIEDKDHRSAQELIWLLGE